MADLYGTELRFTFLADSPEHAERAVRELIEDAELEGYYLEASTVHPA